METRKIILIKVNDFFSSLYHLKLVDQRNVRVIFSQIIIHLILRFFFFLLFCAFVGRAAGLDRLEDFCHLKQKQIYHCLSFHFLLQDYVGLLKL